MDSRKAWFDRQCAPTLAMLVKAECEHIAHIATEAWRALAPEKKEEVKRYIERKNDTKTDTDTNTDMPAGLPENA
jgi:hypothetical protein